MSESNRTIQADTLNNKKSLRVGLVFMPLLLLLAAAVLMLVAQASLASWAETAELHHTIQHLVIFLAGTCAGTSATMLYKVRKRLK